MEAEIVRFEKWRSDSRVRLRNRNATQFQPAPWRDADPLNVQRHAKPLAEFLLNPSLCALRLHIQVHAQEGGGEACEQCRKQPANKSPDPEHPTNITQRSPAEKLSCKTPSSS